MPTKSLMYKNISPLLGGFAVEKNKYKNKRSLLTLRYYSTKVVSNTASPKNSLNPYWVTGLIDGEGSFSVKIVKSPKYRVG